MKINNEFVEQTMKALNIDENNLRLAINGFEIDDDDNKEEECILVIGLNPAGNENDRLQDKERKENSLPYLYCLDEKTKEIKGLTYPKYYRPILDFINQITDEKAKWGWCNIYENKIRNIPILDKHITEIDEYYKNQKDKKYSIYIGDMFYYHETSSKELPLKKDFKKNKNADIRKKYCYEMLRMHIKHLEKHNKKIKFIYMNNAKAAHYFHDGNNFLEIKTNETIDNIPIFYGGMLSGQHLMDTFSVKRLVNEIRENALKD